ncbi:16S rRNA (cytidine(1402)-2'-O)-methyltransferase [Euzebya sp.]|uniref:16S rRNA (cytidine(1402)-2'-O)-methyltransferase n=1 Tax=Euzebya sp. TaxID=1971409 RepID=UPI0035136171
MNADIAPGGGQLVLVATPIGNLDDLSPRAARTLGSADLVACEDTRRTGRLLAHLGVDVPLTAVHDHNEQRRAAEICDRVAAGQVVVLVSDAGTPGISDPGYAVVRAAVARDLPVTAIPGPAAFVHALVISGLPTDRFAFEGFLPRKAGARRDRLAAVAADDRTLLFYVAPHRAADDLAAMAEVLGPDRPAVLTRELTKLHEEALRGTLGSLAAMTAEAAPRGEVTVVVAPAPVVDPEAAVDDAELARRVDDLVAGGLSRRDAVRRVADEAGVSKRRVYDVGH